MDLLFVLSFFTFLVLLFLVMNKIGYSLLRFSIPSLFVISYIVFAYAGTLLLYFGWDAYRLQDGVTDSFAVLKVFLFSASAISVVIGGICFTKYVVRVNDESRVLTPIRPITSVELLLLFFVFCISVAVLAFYVSQVPELAILTSGGQAADIARSNMANAFAGKYHWFSLFMHDFLKLISFTMFAVWLNQKGFFNFVLFLGVFIFAAFASVMTTEKSPFGWLMIGHFLVYLVVRHHSTFPLAKLAKFLPILVGVLVTLFWAFTGAKDIQSSFLSLASRTLTGEVSPAYYYLDFVPRNQEFLHGRTLPNPGSILPFESYNLAQEVMNWKFPEIKRAGIQGSMPTAFWAELYANFGYLGVLIAPFFVGVFLYLASSFIGRFPNTPLKVGFFVWLALHLRILTGSGISFLLFDIYLIFTSILFLVLTVVAQKGHLRLKRYRSPYFIQGARK